MDASAKVRTTLKKAIIFALVALFSTIMLLLSYGVGYDRGLKKGAIRAYESILSNECRIDQNAMAVECNMYNF